jgi:hypothetical protein
MRYSEGLVLYHDEPEYGLSLKIIFAGIAVGLVAGSFYLFSQGEDQGGMVLLFELFLISAIIFGVFPRSYRIYEDHLSIVMGGPFSIKVPFDKVMSIEIPGRFKLTFGVNLVTRMTGKHVAIIQKYGPAISITPKDSEVFVENANRAMDEWSRTHQAHR